MTPLHRVEFQCLVMFLSASSRLSNFKERVQFAGPHSSLAKQMNPRTSRWLSILDETLSTSKKPDFQGSEFSWLTTAPLEDVLDLFSATLDRDGVFDENWDEYWRLFFVTLARRAPTLLDGKTESDIEKLAEEFFEKSSPYSPTRARLAGWLATFDSARLLEMAAQELVENPPASAQDATLALSSLFRAKRDYPIGAIFPSLLQGLNSPKTAALVLDLGNFLMRHRKVERHPAAPLHQELQRLLSQCLTRLELLAESPPVDPQAPGSQQEARTRVEQINEAVTLAISLCDAIAWTGDKSAIELLAHAAGLPHRRLRTEAASALARLEDPRGVEILAELASEPVVRLRALAYLRELGAEDRAPEEFRTHEALAEAEMVVHLAEPTQFGMPPTECDLLDQKTQFWPGYENPVECFLFHYRYRAGGSEYANVGIVGPLTRSVVADLSDLPPPDIYAFYAGWHADHEDIKEVSADEAMRAFPADAAKLQRQAAEAGLTLQLHKLGLFFGDKVLVGVGERHGVTGSAVVDDGTVSFYPFGGKRAPIGPDEAYEIYKGRRLLGSFNRQQD